MSTTDTSEKKFYYQMPENLQVKLWSEIDAHVNIYDWLLFK